MSKKNRGQADVRPFSNVRVTGIEAEAAPPAPELRACWRIVFVAPIGLLNPRGGARKMERELVVPVESVDWKLPGGIYITPATDEGEGVYIPHTSVQAMFAVQA